MPTGLFRNLALSLLLLSSSAAFAQQTQNPPPAPKRTPSLTTEDVLEKSPKVVREEAEVSKPTVSKEVGGVADASGWRRYEFAEAGVSALFPGNPERHAMTGEKTDGQPSLMTFSYRGTEGNFLLMALEAPAYRNLDPEQTFAMLDQHWESLVGGLHRSNGQPISRKLIRLGEHRGLEIVIAEPQGNLVAHMYLANGKFIFAMAGYDKNLPRTRSVNKFLGSLRIGS